MLVVLVSFLVVLSRASLCMCVCADTAFSHTRGNSLLTVTTRKQMFRYEGERGPQYVTPSSLEEARTLIIGHVGTNRWWSGS